MHFEYYSRATLWAAASYCNFRFDNPTIFRPSFTVDFLSLFNVSTGGSCWHDLFSEQVYVKLSALFRVSRMPYPYLDLSDLLSELITHFGVNRIMWGRWVLPVSLVEQKITCREDDINTWTKKSNSLANYVFCFISFLTFCSDFPFVVPECGYKGAKDAVSLIAEQVPVASSELEWITGRTVMKLFPNGWL